MRVLHVVEVEIGGVVTLARTFARAQAGAQDEVHFLAPVGVDVPGASVHTWRPRRSRPPSLVSASRRLAQVVHDVEPDIVHLHSFFPGLLGRTPRQAGLSRAGVVYQPHSWAFEAVPRSARPLITTWERRAGSRTDMLVVNCRDELAEGRRAGVTTPARVLGVPVDTDSFTPVDPSRVAWLREDLDLDGRVVVCVGRLSPQKAQDRLVEAWESSPIHDATLVLVGDGDPRPLQEVAPTQWGRSIRAVGPVEDTRPWLHASDIMIMPSRYEGQSVAMAEAMATGTPVVATPVNGAREAITEGPEPPGGYVSSEHSMPKLMQAAESLLDDVDMLARSREGARDRALRQFATPGVMGRLLEAYTMATGERGAQADG